MLDLEGIREFVAVARFGSFTQAAARLGCSKSYPLRDLVEEGALVVVPGEWARWRVSWYALFPRRTPPVPKVRLLVDFLGEHFARPADFRPLSRAEI